MIYLNIGEPDFTAAPEVQEAAIAAIRAGDTQYTEAAGLLEFRQAISAWYARRFGLDIPARRIMVTAGASGALQLACMALFGSGDEVLMPDPAYPCNRHFVAAAEAHAVSISVGPEQRFQLGAQDVIEHWRPATRGVLLASPSNPTGTSIDPVELRTIVEVVRARKGVTIVDEIYLGLSYDEGFAQSALTLGDDIISVNSFSKYFGMTGWRLGWLVVPEHLIAPLEKLQQNLYICASTVAQRAALACFSPASLGEFERRRQSFKERRDFVVPALEALGLTVPVIPDGAFYVWADCSRYSPSSWDFCMQLMHDAHVALTPGRDFSANTGERYLRLSFASSMLQIRDAVERIKHMVAR